MRINVVISFDKVWEVWKDRIGALSNRGVDVEGLIAYALHMAATNHAADQYNNPQFRQVGYHNLYTHLSKDLREVQPQLALDERAFETTLHQCLDFVGEISTELQALVLQTCGRFDHTVRLERFVAHDAILSFEQ